MTSSAKIDAAANDRHSDLNLSFIARFRAGYGRPLRVLHIGNIANNAYNNACIQRQYGIDADVLCYNYYHIMGCPEWEDGAFQEAASDIKLDHLHPDWWATNLGGWSRPKWFVQGPSALCIDYLRARNAGWKFAAALKWLQLEFTALSDARAEQVENAREKRVPRRLVLHRWLISPSENYPGGGLSLYKYWLGTFVANGILGRRTKAGEKVPKATVFDRVSAAAWLAVRRGRGLLNGGERERIEQARSDLDKVLKNPIVGLPGYLRLGLELLRRLLGKSLSVAAPISYSGLIGATMLEAEGRSSEIEHLTSEIRQDPGELDAQSLSYREEYITLHPRPFEVVLSHYDIIQGYAIDGLIPFINGVKNFTCYEHGTLRDIPFEKNLTGLICRISFQRSPQVFVTNSDVLGSVERLGLERARVTYLPHAFDDRKLRVFREAVPQLEAPRSGPVLFFSPTRQHWMSGDASWQKGNDIFIRAAAEVAKETKNFRLILVEWGQEVPESRELIEELGIASIVDWIPTMPKRELWRWYCTSHAIVDQFVVPALGGVGFESMVLGRRLITAIDPIQTATFFGEAPPCLHARTVEECASRMREVIADPLDTRGLGAAAQKWMGTYHSAERIVALQAKAYSVLLSGQWEASCRRERLHKQKYSYGSSDR